MKFKTTKNKFRTIHRRNQNNSNNLDKKIKKWEKKYKNGYLAKAPKILYDSGWITVGNSSDNIVSDIVNLSNNKYSDKEGDLLPMILNYLIYHEIFLPKKYLPFIKPIIMIKKPDDIILKSIHNYTWNKWDVDEYFEIKGDNTIIYKGYHPEDRFLSHSEINKANISFSHTSKWYRGTLKYNIGADNYELRNGFIVSVKSYYNIHNSICGGTKDWEALDCSAIDLLSSSSMTGTGTHIESERYLVGASCFQKITTTKNVTATVPIFDNITHIRASGFLYKNGALQGYYSDLSPLTVKFSGSLNGDGSLPAGEAGNATLIDFDYNLYKLNEEQIYRLWWSSTRAQPFLFNSSTYNFNSLADKDLYETDTLPYINLTVKVNHDPYPLLEEQENIEYTSKEQITFSKISESIATEERYVAYINGKALLIAPATKDNGTSVNFADDIYGQSGDTYMKTSEDRTPKEVSRFVPETQNIFFRYKLVLMNNFYFHEIKKEKKTKRF